MLEMTAENARIFMKVMIYNDQAEFLKARWMEKSGTSFVESY